LIYRNSRFPPLGLFLLEIFINEFLYFINDELICGIFKDILEIMMYILINKLLFDFSEVGVSRDDKLKNGENSE
jgi:hypothetical protein